MWLWETPQQRPLRIYLSRQLSRGSKRSISTKANRISSNSDLPTFASCLRFVTNVSSNLPRGSIRFFGRAANVGRANLRITVHRTRSFSPWIFWFNKVSLSEELSIRWLVSDWWIFLSFFFSFFIKKKVEFQVFLKFLFNRTLYLNVVRKFTR